MRIFKRYRRSQRQRRGLTVYHAFGKIPSGQRWLIIIGLVISFCVMACIWGLTARTVLQVFLPQSAPDNISEPQPSWQNNVHENSENIRMVWAYRPSSLTSIPEGVNVLAPTWFYVEDSDGKAVLQNLSDMGYKNWDADQYVSFAHENHVEVWGTVVSLDPELSDQVVNDTQCQQQFIQGLSDWVQEYDLDGISFDFEKMNPADKDSFTRLVQLTKEALPADKKVSVAVTVPTRNEQPDNWWQCYDREELAKVCDYIAIMAYDNNDGMIGPIAGYNWVEEMIQLTLAQVPSEKLILGVPFFGVGFTGEPYKNEYGQLSLEWDGSSENRFTIYPSDIQLLESEGFYTRGSTTYTVDSWLARGVWDQTYQTRFWAFLDTDGILHELWVEDSQSLSQKAALERQYCLAGSAVWRYKFGREDLWEGLYSNSK